MRRIRIMGPCLVAAGAIGAGSAAALPEVGRCVKQAGGKYSDGNCTVKTKGEFEFVKNAVGKRFTIENVPGKKTMSKGRAAIR